MSRKTFIRRTVFLNTDCQPVVLSFFWCLIKAEIVGGEENKLCREYATEESGEGFSTMALRSSCFLSASHPSNSISFLHTGLFL